MYWKNIIIPFVILFLMSILFSCEKDNGHKGSPVDGDGNEYDTVVIGTQTWLKENLKTTKYRFGNPVRLITDNTEWTTWQQGAYCWDDNNPEYKDIYGALYNWHAAHTQALCPDGWHVPTIAEWNILIDYCGGEYEAGCKLKEAGLQHWAPTNSGTNESGFTALPGGFRYFYDGSFQMIKSLGGFWASDIEYYIGLMGCSVSPVDWYKQAGMSIRCLKDK
jgi:uncharacterized protein (TIGR02145 family)